MSAIESVLLRRLGTVHIDRPPAAASPGLEGVRPLEGELLERGHALSAELYAALSVLAPTDLAEERLRLLALVDELMGADRVHKPLFRRFPFSIPHDTERWYVARVFALLLQEPEQPCVLCGEHGTVHPVAPCAHLVCRTCWDGADHTGCPVCNRRVDPADPFLRPDRDERAKRAGRTTEDLPVGPLRLLRLGTDLPGDCARVVASLLARQTPLSPEDRDDLALLIAAAPADLGWFPEEIPVRETKALVLGTLLGDWRTEDAARALLAARLTTATDVLRLLAVVSGGEAGLLPLPRFANPGRPLRRELLAVLDALNPQYLVEDLLRHPTAWKRAAERLHPFERHARHPRAALAFAVLRGTTVSAATPFGAALLETAAAHPDAVRVDGDRIRPATWSGRIEEALAHGDAGAAAALAGERPGELVRRLDHLLRLHPGEEFVPELEKALERALPAVGAGPLLSALGALRARAEDRRGGRRVFFPRGEVARAQVAWDERAPLPAPLVEEVVARLEAEVLRRFAAAEGEPYELAVLDSGLADLTVPFGERTAARALVAVPRGSTQILPEGEVLRLFLHWTEPAGNRTDLDLSVAFFDAEWRFTGVCDYTTLRHGPRGAATHSGDLTSAPAPDGATEYVDLDLAALAGNGDAFAVPLVFAFDNVPFDELPDAFAGFMALPADGPRDSSYDPRSVRQRFDLAGQSRVCMPMVVDLASRRALWADVHLPPSGGFQSVASHGNRLGSVARDVWEHFGSGTRTSMWDLVVWRAAARSRQVAVVRRSAGPELPDELWLYRAGDCEPAAAFASRISALEPPQERRGAADADAEAAQVAAGRRVFLATVHAGAAPAAASGTAYRLFPGPAEASGEFARVSAGDLLAELGRADIAATAVGRGRYPL
ncbi:MXAN_6230/SCO0854 family RING domain-containing protein [Streptomyces sp. NPDC059835]|uniref:MXAN_6230/SCO0854 family RING domain-containing protein n=1 Tax=Streptomyces sp. NPDC059835 TaxID=3346967 RepID=UPI003659FC4F